MLASPSPAAAVEYRPAIDGLRAVAVLAVCLFHLDRRWLPGGFAGVDIFFAISGYLITSVILRDCDRNRFSFGRFYQRRIARLLAAFVAVAVATLIGAFFIYSPQDLATTGATLAASAASLANLKFMLQGNYFALSPDAQPFLHCWSLSVEEQFYLLFPAIFFVLYLKAKTYRIHVLTGLFVVSLLTSVALTHVRPEWAFYLLPSRACELLAGSILATLPGRGMRHAELLAAVRIVGLALIGISFWAISEGPRFPGYAAMLPVIGTGCLLLRCENAGGLAERILSSHALVLAGRMSYSIYLWHWPVFSLVDYKFYWETPLVRLALKILVTGVASAGCFALIERPGRLFLNHPGRRGLAFAALACSLVILIPLGIAVRNANYVNADLRAIRKGGVRFNRAGQNGSMVLMGDSNGSMYGKMATEIARERGFRLDVISVEAGDPLPRSTGRNPALWLESMAVVKREKPDFLVLVCNWGKLREDPNRLSIALQELKPYVRFVFLITQPPVLPEIASREGIRSGHRPPFREDPQERAVRMELNEFVKRSRGDNVTVVDIEPLFSRNSGEVRFVDDGRKQLYQDRDHLSTAGANLVKPDLVKAISSREIGGQSILENTMPRRTPKR